MRFYPSFLIALMLVIVVTPSCKISLSGASVAPDIKTIKISNFTNTALKVNPSLSRNLTETLKNTISTQTSLSINAPKNDLELEGVITSYDIQPLGIQGQGAAENQLTISISVRFVNTKDETKNFEQSFTRFAKAPASQNIATVEPVLVDEVNQLLAQDIFNKIFINW
jgi:hypothetical protein